MSNLQCVQVLAGPGAPPHQTRVGPRPATAQAADIILKNINSLVQVLSFSYKISCYLVKYTPAQRAQPARPSPAYRGQILGVLKTHGIKYVNNSSE